MSGWFRSEQTCTSNRRRIQNLKAVAKWTEIIGKLSGLTGPFFRILSWLYCFMILLLEPFLCKFRGETNLPAVHGISQSCGVRSRVPMDANAVIVFMFWRSVVEEVRKAFELLRNVTGVSILTAKSPQTCSQMHGWLSRCLRPSVEPSWSGILSWSPSGEELIGGSDKVKASEQTWLRRRQYLKFWEGHNVYHPMIVYRLSLLFLLWSECYL